MEEWLLENMYGVLLTIEVLWVAAFLAIFLAYFLIRRHFAKQKPRPPDRRGPGDGTAP